MNINRKKEWEGYIDIQTRESYCLLVFPFFLDAMKREGIGTNGGELV